MNPDELLERATADFFWVPDDVEVVTRPEITYCHSERQDVVFNRVVRARPASADIAELVDEVRAAHRGSISRWMLNAFSNTAALRRALTDAGYEQTSRCFAYVLQSDAYRRTPPDDVDVREVDSLEDLRTLYDIAHVVFGDRRPLSDRDLERELDDCTGPDRRVVRFVAHRRDTPAGVAGMTVFDDLQFGLLWGGGVHPDHRGRGVYTALLQRRADFATAHDLDRIGLYAREDTSAPIVDAHGFQRHGPKLDFDLDLTSEG